MIRQLFRVFVAGVCLLSLLLCVGAAWLWRRGNGGDENRLSFRVAGQRYNLRTAGGRFDLYGPPSGARAGDPDAALASRVRNDQIDWTLFAFLNAPASVRHIGNLLVGMDDEAPMSAPYQGITMKPVPRQPTAIRPLLAALDDPDRFAAAHALLWTEWSLLGKSKEEPWPMGGDTIDYWGPVTWPDATPTKRGDRLAIAFGGLPVVGSTAGRELDYWTDGGQGSHTEYVDARPDPASMAAVRKLWHDRFDVPFGSTRCDGVVAGLTLPPVLWLASAGRLRIIARRRARTGRCVACGYDLTGDVSGVCPECGATPTHAKGMA